MPGVRKVKRTETVKQGGKSQYPSLDTKPFEANLTLLLDGLSGYTQGGFKLPTLKLKELAPSKVYQVLGCFVGAESSGPFSKEGQYDEYVLICELSSGEFFVVYQNNAATKALEVGFHFSPFNTGEQYQGHEIWGVTLFETTNTEVAKQEMVEPTKTKTNYDDIPF